MTTEIVTGRQPVAKRPRTRFLSGRRGRKVKEALLAYALLLPAFLIILVFGIFPPRLFCLPEHAARSE